MTKLLFIFGNYKMFPHLNLRKYGITLLIAFITSLSAFAQQIEIRGKILEESSKSSVIGATIRLKGKSGGTVSDANGDFNLNIKTLPVTLLISNLGYKNQEIDVYEAEPVIIYLAEGRNRLNEVIVTGLATGLKRSNLANAITSISNDELTGTTPPQTVDQALYGKIPGASIRSNSGAPGGGTAILLRGLSTLQGNSQPLYIIDGVYLNNNSLPTGKSTLTAAGTSREDDVSNRLADINPDDIEKIEVLKGASASAIYGTRANAGVIIITTKKGKSGKTKISFGQDIGFATIGKYIGSASWDAAKIKQAFPASIQARELQSLAAANGKVYDFEKILYGETPLLRNTNLTVSGGNDKTTFYVSGSLVDEEGIIKNTGFDRLSLRLNLDHKFNKWIDFSVNSNYLNSNTDRGFTGNENNSGATLGYIAAFLPNYYNPYPVNGIYPSNPYSEGENPLELRDKAINNAKINRFIQSGIVNFKFIQKENTTLKLSLQGGVDFLSQNSKEYYPDYLQSQSNLANPGDLLLGTTQQINTNFQGFLIYGQKANKFQFTTQVGAIGLETQSNSLFDRGQGLVAGQQSIGQARVQSVITQNTQKVQDFGTVGQEEINFNDQIIGTAGLRFDKSTLNGDANKFYAFPKASLAINLTKFDFWKISTISEFKLRTAYGETGGLPPYGSIYSSLTPVIVGGNLGSVVSTTVGNPNIKPERAGELEFGTDIGLFNNRLVFEGTYYVKNVSDLIQDLTLAQSTGLGTEKVNAASLSNKGIELSLSGTPISGRDFTWNSRIQFAKNTSKITKLDVPSYTTGVYGVTFGTYLIKEGYSPTTIVGKPLTASGNYTVYGNSQPDFQTSWFNDFSFLNGFDLSALWDWKKGGKVLNLTLYNTDAGETTADWNENHTVRENDLGTTAAQYVQDASYLRLREVGLNYTIPKKSLQYTFAKTIERIRVGVSATNLITITPYKGYDPEVSSFGSESAINSGTDLFQYPSSKRILFNLKIDL
ncbi:MAG: SusC/RagA family TonB-linked outer membrane protein [Bacteroidota bacterium]|nr:SusC/RagA family TonB-linked outer membrane protein [Bacteroidota bacterium]